MKTSGNLIMHTKFHKTILLFVKFRENEKKIIVSLDFNYTFLISFGQGCSHYACAYFYYEIPCIATSTKNKK
jgi:hypothetical protein